MNKLIIQFDDRLETYENVTKIKCLCAFDVFKNYLEIHQGNKKTKIKLFDVIDYEIRQTIA